MITIIISDPIQENASIKLIAGSYKSHGIKQLLSGCTAQPVGGGVWRYSGIFGGLSNCSDSI